MALEQRLSENSVEASYKMKRSIALSVSRKHDGGCEEALGLGKGGTVLKTHPSEHGTVAAGIFTLG